MLGLLPVPQDENVARDRADHAAAAARGDRGRAGRRGRRRVVSGLAFNFFFTQPYHSPQIESTATIAAFVVYLAVAITGGVLVARLREARELASRRAADATLLQALTVELIRNAEAAVTLRSALVQLCDSLGLRGVCLLTVAGADQLVARAGESDDAERVARDLLGRLVAAPGRLVALREPRQARGVPDHDAGHGVRVRRRRPGGARASGADREKFLESFTGVVALALTRARLGEERVRRRALEETDRLRTVLLQSVSHDLRTPLTAIKATAAALQTETSRPSGAASC